MRNARLVALCLAGTVLLNFPLLTLWDGRGAGTPLAVFGLWALLIGVAAWITERGGDGD
jgi:hypothetical protein